MPPLPGTERPLDPVASIRVKIGLLVALSIVAAVVMLQVGSGAGVPGWLTIPVTLAAALGVTLWLARGMTSPLREMTRAAGQMASGDYSGQVVATSADEVGLLARAFNTMATELASADQQRRQLLATVSHELRTPLAGQRAVLENLVDGVISADDAALQAALDQSERLSALVEDLLDVSRVDGGAVALDVAPAGVADLVAAGIAEASVSNRDVVLESSVEPPDLSVEVDVARLAQVVANLLDNAIRHSPPGGTVTVRVSTLETDQWALEVIDEGDGIRADQAERVFTRFGVGDDAGGGTGLGLAIASWVCQLHGGSIVALPPMSGQTGGHIRAVLPRHPLTQHPLTQPAGLDHTQHPEQQRPEHVSPGLHTATGPTPSSQEPPVNPPAPALGSQPRAFAPSAPVFDPLFTELWPEREPHTAPLPLILSLAIGALAALILPERLATLGTLLVLVPAGVLVLFLSVYRGRRWTITSAALCLGLVSLTVLRAAEWLSVLALMAAGVLVVAALTDARRVLPMLAAGIAWVLSGVRGLPLLGRTLSLTRQHRLLWPVLRTVALSVVALVVFGGLFASGDAVFGSWVASIVPTVSVADTLVLRGFVWFLVGGIVLAGCYLAINPPAVEKVALPPGRPVTRRWEWLVPVGVVIAVFAGFLIAQASALFAGHDFVLATTGLTYADYARQGFAQLTLATALTLITMAVAVRKAARSTEADRRLQRVVLGVLCLLTLVVVGSALFRMHLYQQAYGYTVLRVLVDAFEVWLGILVVLVMVAGVRMSGWWLPRAALVTGTALLLTIGLINPEAWVAEKNIDRYEATGKLDTYYLAGLGADAAPVMVARLPEDVSKCIFSQRVDTSIEARVLNWNLGQARANEIPAFVAGGVDRFDTACPDEIGESIPLPRASEG
ncbi:MAG: DUF4153 domain-containing protein [Ornithinimicrobium sp.]